VVAALQEPVVLVGKNSQLGAIELGRWNGEIQKNQLVGP
jgi:hypothetical protein